MSTDMQYVYDVYDGMCLNRRGSLRVLTLQEVLTVLVAICRPLGKVATRFRLSPHMPCQAAVASGPDGRRCSQQYHTKASRSESAEPNNVHDTRRQHTTQHRLPISLFIFIYIYITRVSGQIRDANHNDLQPGGPKRGWWRKNKYIYIY